MLTVLGENNRLVYLADSFHGLPPVDPNFKVDAVHTGSEKALPTDASLERVKDYFFHLNLLNERKVKFLKGWFKRCLQPIYFGQLALLRMDGDLFAST